MNSLFSLKYAWRWLAALAAMGILLLAAGCGTGGGLIHSLGGNYTNASLKGQYVISQTGIGINQAVTAADPFSETIVFTADGNGNLTVAVDDFDQSGTLFEDANLSGTYRINKDGTGSLQVILSGGSLNYAITMIDDSHFYVIQQDTFATSSGFGEKQDSTAFAAVPSGNFVFKAHNLDTSSRVGGISIANGAISGNQDRLDLGSPSINESISGSVSATPPDSNGRGTFTFTDSGGSTAFFYYVVSAGKFHFLSNNGSLEIGQAEAQSGGPFSVATLAAGTSYVFGSAGDTGISGPAGIHSAGVFSTDGNGNITPGGAVDYVQDITVNANLGVTGGSYTLTSNGHGQINLTLSGGTISPQIFWMVNGTHAYFLANSTLAVEDGTFTLQQGAPFSSLGNQAAFVMDGFDVAFKDRVGAFQPTTSGFKWNQNANSFDANINDINFGGTPTALGTSGTAQVSSNGRVVVTVNGVTNVANSWVFYLSSASSGVMVQEDADIGGEFTLQAGQ